METPRNHTEVWEVFNSGKLTDARAARGSIAARLPGRAVAGLILPVLILIAILRGLLLVGLAGRSLGG